MSATAGHATRLGGADPGIGADASKLKEGALREHAIRFGFGAAVSVTAAIIGKLFGAHVGGLFLAFPAILPATLTLLEKHQGTEQAVADVRGSVLGAVGLLGFAAVVVIAGAAHPLPALVAAPIVWIVVAVALYMVLTRLADRMGEEQYLPEVPSSECEPLMHALAERGWTVGVAESCSGGTLGALLTACPAAGTTVAGGVIAYTNHLKRSVLDVPDSVLREHGAISADAALAMARGARARLGCDVAVAITGASGPPAEGVPSGTTYVAVALPGGRAAVHRVAENRGAQGNRGLAVRDALQFATKIVEEGGSE
jgi:nicotinamide-nucleotide amidase